MNDVAVVCDAHSPQAALARAYLHERGIEDATWYAPRDADDVEQAIRAGTVRRVVFPQMADFLALLWDEILTPDIWKTPALRVEFAAPDDAPTSAQITGVVAAWESWRQRRRRWRAVAGLILSALAIAAAWTLLALAQTPSLRL